jgi:molybdopterin molybdotransferase
MRHGTSIPLEEAFRRIDAALAGTRLPAGTLPVRAALGRVLARPQTSRLDLPPFDKSAVDGYAVPDPGGAGPWRVAATVSAGMAGPRSLRPGEAVKVMTGAPVPRGTRRVVMVEDAEERGGTVAARRAGGPSNICPRAEDMRRGGAVLPAGRRLGPLDAANLAACGIVRVPVVREPRVALLATGDEIVDDPALLRPGRIMNSNGPLLAALCAAHGLEVVLEDRVPDALDDLVRALRTALRRADLVILSGGVSVGDFDLVPAAFSRLGLRTRFSRVAVKPGRPATFATGRGRALFGLPGNPVSVYVMFHLMVLRAAARLTGAALPDRAFRLPLARGFRRRRADRTEFVPARLDRDGRAEALPIHGSADLLALTPADGLISIGTGTRSIPAGARVDFYPAALRWP